MKHLYIVTHPESQHHLDHRVGGWFDSELSERGLAQAERIGQRLRTVVPDDAPLELYTSDLTRTHQTAEVISRLVRTPVHAMADLREKSYGEAEGKPQAWLDERFLFPPQGDGRMDHWEGIRGAETRRDLGQRIYRAMDQILARDCVHQIIVTHGFALTFVVAAWIKMPLDAAGHIAIITTSGGISHLHQDDRFQNRGIVSLNETAHLAGT